MRRPKLPRIAVSIFAGAWSALLHTSCTTTPSSDGISIDVSSLATLASIKAAPTSNFLIDSTGWSHVSRTSPLMGSSSGCAHDGSHLQFLQTSSSYTVDLYAPYAGIVSAVTPCYLNGANDKYGVTVAVANDGGAAVTLDYSIEPMGGYFCSGGASGSNNGFYQAYLLVAAGDTVTAGQLIAKLYVPGTSSIGQDSTHIHFNVKTGSQVKCPSLFDSSVATQMQGKFNASTLPVACQSAFTGMDSATLLSSMLCYGPSSSESL